MQTYNWKLSTSDKFPVVKPAGNPKLTPHKVKGITPKHENMEEANRGRDEAISRSHKVVIDSQQVLDPWAVLMC